MLKKRIIPVQLLLDGRLVKTRRFVDWRDVGDPVKSSAVYNSQNADELLFLNISRKRGGIDTLREVIEAVSKVSFMPMTIGGGIATAADAAELIATGADKIVVNSCAYRDPDVITRTAETFGTQAVIVGIDVRRDPDTGRYHLFSDCGRQRELPTLAEHIARVVDAGAGEIFIQSIDCDGMMEGFDIDLIAKVMALSRVPVIGAGGSGHYNHLRDAFLETDVSALACGSIFNFSDSNPMRAKAFLSNHGLAFKVL